MKTFLLILFLLASASGLVAGSNDSLVGDADEFLEMRGRVLESQGQQRDEEKKALPDADYVVMNESGKAVLKGNSDSKGRLSFKLPLGRKFTVSITKQGYVKKLISVDTHVPADARKAYGFAFDLDIFELVDGLDVSVLEKPVALVSYKAADKNFSYDPAYTNKVNGALQKMYREYYTLRRRDEMASRSDTTATAKRQASKPKRSEPYGKDSKPH